MEEIIHVVRSCFTRGPRYSPVLLGVQMRQELGSPRIPFGVGPKRSPDLNWKEGALRSEGIPYVSGWTAKVR